MQTHDRPRLRPYVVPAQDEGDPHHVYLVDQLGLTAKPRRITVEQFHWVRLFDGERTLGDIHVEAGRLAGQFLPLERVAALARELDEHLLLDGVRYQGIVGTHLRPPRHIGCYEGEPAALRRQLDEFFAAPRGPGRPRAPRPDGRLRAVLVPHIDYPRGGHTYAWGFKELFERSEASLFVIIGTSHYSERRFTLTRKDFATPLGTARTDQDYVDRLVKHHGDGLFDDELMAHLPEHSIELEVVFLQHLYQGVRDIRIVPLVVGSFYDCVQRRQVPSLQPDVRRMVEALRRAEDETPEPICYVISGDLAHIGPKFGDPLPVAEPFLAESRTQDHAIVRAAERADPTRYFQVIADEDDVRRICGLPPTYTVLEAVRPRRGKLLHYDQYVHPQGNESVSFASVAFYA